MTDLPWHNPDEIPLDEDETPTDEQQSRSDHSTTNPPRLNPDEIPLDEDETPTDEQQPPSAHSTTSHEHESENSVHVTHPPYSDDLPPRPQLGSPFKMIHPKSFPHEPDEYDETDLAGLETPGGPTTPVMEADRPPIARKSNFEQQGDQSGGDMPPQSSNDGSKAFEDGDHDMKNVDHDLRDVNDDMDMKDGDEEEGQGGVARPARDPFKTPAQNTRGSGVGRYSDRDDGADDGGSCVLLYG